MAGEKGRGRRGIAVAVVLLLVSGAALGEEPWSGDPQHPVFENRPAEKAQRVLTASPFYFAFRVWAELLTKIDGRRCAHRPSCSRFAHEAIRRQGVPVGIWMALSRLMRGAQSSSIRRLTLVGGYLVDTVEDYTFWW